MRLPIKELFLIIPIIIIIIIIIISNEFDYGGIVTLLLQDHLTMSVSRNSAKAVSRQDTTA